MGMLHMPSKKYTKEELNNLSPDELKKIGCNFQKHQEKLRG